MTAGRPETFDPGHPPTLDEADRSPLDAFSAHGFEDGGTLGVDQRTGRTQASARGGKAFDTPVRADGTHGDAGCRMRQE